MGSPPCRLQEGIHYRWTNSGYERCRKKDCPPYEKGKMNCWCCNGPDEHPVNGGWSNWSKWAHNCDALNTRLRFRTCTNPAPQRNGTVCYSQQFRERSMHEYQQTPCQSSTILMFGLGGFIVTLILALIVLGLMLSKKSRQCRRISVGTKDDDEEVGLTSANEEGPGMMYEECASGGVSKRVLFNRTISDTRSTVNLGQPPKSPTTPTTPSVLNFEQASSSNINT